MRLLLLLLWLGCQPVFARPLVAEDILKLAEIAEPVMTPDGASLIYSVTQADTKRDEQYSDLWMTRWSDGAKRNLTRTANRSEWQPRLTADGRQLFFLSDRSGDTQVWRMALRNGNAKQITRQPGGVSDFDVSPDGSLLAVTAEVGEHVADRKAPRPIHVTRLFFKQDHRGYLDDRRLHLLLVNVASGKSSTLAGGDFDQWMPVFSPDGRSIAFVAKRDADADRASNFDLFVIAAEAGAQPRRISRFVGADNDPEWESRPAWSPDSRQLVWLEGGEDKWIYYAPQQLSVADVASGAVRAIARIDRWFSKPRFGADGKSILALVEQDRATTLVKIDLADERMTMLRDGERSVRDFAAAADRIALLETDAQHPARLLSLDAAPRLLADHNEWLKEVTLAPLQAIRAASQGETINGFVMVPANRAAAGPAIVRIHGGPVSQYDWQFMFDWQLYAANGYAVIAANPRGSSGRGFEFSRAIYADWGNRDVADVLAITDEAVRRGLADPQRLGIGGWSYGSILTNYVIASTHRFKAAVSGAGVSFIPGLYGVDQYVREYQAELGAPWEAIDLWLKLSYPFLKSGQISTPTLFQCALADFNVPCAGAEQMYQALRIHKVPSELLLYPDQNHGLTRPSFMVDRLKRNLDWYGRYLNAVK